MIKTIRRFLPKKKQKFDNVEKVKVTNVMNKECVCENPCNEYCNNELFNKLCEQYNVPKDKAIVNVYTIGNKQIKK